MSPPDGSGASWAWRDVTPRHYEPIGRRGRLTRALERLEDLRQSLIAKLDVIDGDPDFEQSISGSQACGWGHGIDLEAAEEDAGEPSLGWPEKVDQRSLGAGSEELEPSLGSVEGWYGDQTRWGQDGGVRDDREWECEDEGAQVDAEPDRDGDGTPNTVWAIGAYDMHKIDGADHETVDLDEAPEHFATLRAEWGMGR